MEANKVYTTEPCSFCARVKGLLKARGVEFSEINLSKDPAGRVELAQRGRGAELSAGGRWTARLLGGFTRRYRPPRTAARLDELLAA